MPDVEIQKKFGKRLRYLRRSRDISQEQLAESIGRSVGFISLLERGESAPSLETIVRLAEALGVEVGELFRFDGK
ncbi:MAG TPA: helix-turn-helix transcriptional regulator [Ktedonobacteraceae bacterium]|nr:helix-turn-helix transcriptional regulator [Ktedonobacteraceae bacterium]